jgi:DNA-binding HxlR family transcriptional regulator
MDYSNYKSVRGRTVGEGETMETHPARRPAGGPAIEDDACDSSEGRTLCPVLAAVGVIGTEWRLAIVHRLLEGPQRFSEILKSNVRLNAKTLSATLKFLEGQGVVQRTVVSTRPFSVVYSLTEMGLGLAPAARELRLWGERWLLPRAAQSSRAAAAAARRPPTIQGELPRIVVGESDARRGH